jgi:hypothetical protein
LEYVAGALIVAFGLTGPFQSYVLAEPDPHGYLVVFGGMFALLGVTVLLAGAALRLASPAAWLVQLIPPALLGLLS